MADKQRREPHWLNKKQVLRAFDVSSSTFDGWSIEPVARIGRETFFNVGDVHRHLMAKESRRLLAKIEGLEQKNAERRSGLDGDGRTIEEIRRTKEIEQTRLIAEQADTQAMKNEMMRHEVAPFEWHQWVFSKTASVLVGMIDALPVELMRKLNLKPKEVEKVRAVTSTALDSVSILGDREWLESVLDEYLRQAD